MAPPPAIISTDLATAVAAKDFIDKIYGDLQKIGPMMVDKKHPYDMLDIMRGIKTEIDLAKKDGLIDSATIYIPTNSGFSDTPEVPAYFNVIAIDGTILGASLTHKKLILIKNDKATVYERGVGSRKNDPTRWLGEKLDEALAYHDLDISQLNSKDRQEVSTIYEADIRAASQYYKKINELRKRKGLPTYSIPEIQTISLNVNY